jgi:hypothetical protein
MTLTIDADFVWKSRNIFRTVPAKLDNDAQEFKILKKVVVQVLTSFPEACQAVILAVEELGGEPWQPFPQVGT